MSTSILLTLLRRGTAHGRLNLIKAFDPQQRFSRSRVVALFCEFVEVGAAAKPGPSQL